MDAQIENAIQIGWTSTDQTLKRQAFQFLDQLRTDPQGWQVCFRLFTRTPRASDLVRFVSLEVVNNAIASSVLDDSSKAFLKNAALEYVRRMYGGTEQEEADPAHLQNKLTQTLTYLFVVMYREGWPTFVDDFLALISLPNSLLKDNIAGVFMYLRLLSSIHDEIADQLLSGQNNLGQGNEGKRNSDLKDLVRDRDVQKIARSWQDILAHYGNKNGGVVELTLRVMGKWVSWIDISLVINQNMMSLLLPLVGRTNGHGGEDKVRDAAIDAYVEIVAKKMQPRDKIELIYFLNLKEIIGQLIASPPLHEFKSTPQYDHDLAEAVAKLVNTIMTDIVKILEDPKVDREVLAKGEQLLQDFLPSLLRFFSDEFDEVCSTVIPSLTDILTHFRRSATLAPAHSEALAPILNAIIMKMRYDETSNWGNEDEQTDEAEFQELRKRLQNLQKSVAAVKQDLYIEVLAGLVANTFTNLEQQGSQMDWRDLDLALHELYLFGELALPNSGVAGKSQPNPVATERLVGMMIDMVDSAVADYSHPAILLQYMEIVVRYSAFFETHQQWIPKALGNFVRLLHHTHARIRTRSWYLFLRFVKQLRGQVGGLAKTVIQSISDLLPIKAEVAGNDADDDMSDDTDHSADSVFNSQLYLYEAIGSISSTASTPSETQALYARSVMEPLFFDMEQHLPRARAGDAQAILQIHHIVMALGTLANGFAEWHAHHKDKERRAPHKSVADEFSRAAEAMLIALRELNTNSEIRAACRSAFSRLLGVLGSAVLPQLPQWIEGLLSQSSSKDEMAMFLRTLERVVFAFKSEIYNVLDLILTPLLERVFGGLSEPIHGTDDEIQMQELRREYLTFLQIILSNDLGGVLVSEKNQGFFETLVTSIITLAKTIAHGNLTASRIGFNVLSRMALQWGGPDVAAIVANPQAPTRMPTPVIAGFDSFMIERFHTACWEVLQDPLFRPATDAQTKQVLNEIAGLEQTIYAKTGDMFIQHLQGVTFPCFGVEDPEGFLCAMTSSVERRLFTGYLQGLVKWRRCV